jgi:hypothetical protein
MESWASGFIDWLVANQLIWVPIATLIASALCAVLKTRAGRLYWILEVIALNFWRAKDKPGEDSWKRSSGTLLPMLFTLVLGLNICMLPACGGFTSNSYVALSVAGTAYDTAFKTLGALHAQGKIDDATKQKAIEVGEVYYVAYHEAVTALEVYKAVKDAGADEATQATAKGKVLDWLTEVQKQLNNIRGYAGLSPVTIDMDIGGAE